MSFRPSGRRWCGLGRIAAAAAAVAVVLTAANAGSSAPQAGEAVFSLLPDPDRTPAYFIFTAAPGSTVTDRLRLTNVGTAAGAATLYAVDATTGASTGIVYRSAASVRRDVGRWLHLTVSRVELQPGETKTIAFAATVPRSVWRGQHVGGIVAEAAPETVSTRTGKGTGFGVRIRHLAIVAAEFIVPGRLQPQINVSRVRARKWGRRQQILLGMTNSGTMIVKPIGKLLVYSAATKRLVKRLDLRLDSFLPKTSISYPVFVPGRRLRVGKYIARVMVRYPPAKTTRFSGSFAVTSR